MNRITKKKSLAAAVQRGIVSRPSNDASDIAAKIEGISRAFEEFKALNDARINEIAKKGNADPLLASSVEKANNDITNLMEQVKALQAKQARTGTGSNPSNYSARQLEAISAHYQVPVEELSSDHFAKVEQYRADAMKFLRKGVVSNEMSVDSDPDGGYLVSPDTSGRVIDLVYETSPMRQLASSITISTDSYGGLLDLDEAAFGGWVGERQTRTETGTPQLGKWEIRVHEMYAEPHATQRLLDDASVNVEAWLAMKVADKFARIENAAFVNGDGAGKPRGFLTYTVGSAKTSKANFGKQLEGLASGAASSLGSTDQAATDKLIDTVFLLKPRYRAGANWVMNRKTLATIRKLKDGDNNYIWQPDFTQQQGGNVLGYSIVEAEDMPDIGAGNIPIAFGNFATGYLIVDRAGIRVLRDPYTAKPYVKFYTTKRVGGDVVDFDAIKLFKIGTSL